MFRKNRTLAPALMPLAASAVCLTALPAFGQTKYPGIMPLSQVRAGMKGYGLTTFRGTTISRFEVTVLGIVRKANNGRDLILIRMQGGPITERHANLVKGMSGSPIYINGKLIGGFSQGESFSKEPVGMATPIEDMLEAWDPKIPQRPLYFTPAEINAPRNKPLKTGWRPNYAPHAVTLKEPIVVGNRRISRLVLNSNDRGTLRSNAGTAVLHLATTFLSVTGLRPQDREWLQRELDQKGYHVTVAQGGGVGRSSEPIPATLRPGSAFGTFLATGDVFVGSTGTVTYRLGDRMLGYGHPFFGLGSVEAALTSASIVDIFSGYEVSHHIATVGAVIGTMTQDRDYSVAGILNRKPRMVPFEVTVNDKTQGRLQTFRIQMILHPDMTPTLMRLAVRQAVAQIHNIPGDVMAKVQTSVTADEVGTLTRQNIAYDGQDPSSVVTQDLTDILNVVSGNPFYPLPIRGGKVSIELTGGRNTATIERIYLKQGRFEPGETVEIGVALKPYRQPTVMRTLRMTIPSSAPTGRYQLLVRGGAPTVQRFGAFSISTGSNDPQTPPATIQQMVEHLKEQSLNTDIVGRLVLNATAPASEGERLSQLPPHLAAFMRSERNSNTRLEREEVKTIQGVGYVTTGTQTLLVNVVRKNNLETPAPRGGSPSEGSPSAPGSSPLRLGNPSGSDDEAAMQGVPLLPFSQWKSVFEGTKGSAFPAPHEEAEPQAQPPTSPAAAAAPAALVKPADTTPDKPIGRQTQIWRQRAKTDFTAGKLNGASVTSNGELRLAPAIKRLAATDATYIWSLVSDAQGNLYAGTGTGGHLLKITPQGRISTLATLPAISLHSLILGKDGAFYAGTSAKGILYRIGMDGKVSVVGKTGERYLTALAQDEQGNLYAGAGSSGTIYRKGATESALKPFARLSTDFITALATDMQGNLYAASGNDGAITKISPDGKTSVLYSVKDTAVTALTVSPQGEVYFGTGPRGALYRLSSEGAVSPVIERATSYFMSLQFADKNTLYALTTNTLYKVNPNALGEGSSRVTPLDNPKDSDFLSLALLPNGRVAVGTANMGEVYTSASAEGSVARGTYESAIYDARLESRWGRVQWAAQIPQGASLTFETRSGNVAEPDATWSQWASVPLVGASEGSVPSPVARFLQYRITLINADANAPLALREVAFHYIAKNQVPRIAFQSPLGGERWSKSQTLRWNAQDPDNDTLVYEVFYSGDNGTTWKPLPSAAPVKTDITPSVPVQGTQPTTLEEMRQKLDSAAMPQAMRDLLLERFRQRLAQPQAGAAVPSKENSRALDTALLPDGFYLLKVMASDHLSNPTDSKHAQGISEPFLVCNALPQIDVVVKPVVTPDKAVALTGVALQKLVAVSALQYRVDDGEWAALVSDDGIFDASQERFTLLTAPLSSGKHTIEILAFNAVGGKTSLKVSVEIP